MNKKSIIRTLLALLIILGAFIFYKYFLSSSLNLKGWEIETNNQVQETDKDIEEQEDKYKDLWINPNDYEKIEDFLEDTETLSGLTLDISKNDFVTCTEKTDWKVVYNPYYHDFIRKWFFKNKDYKNQAIEDIYKSYKKNCIVWGYKSDSKSKVIFEWDIGHNDTYILNEIFTKKRNIDETVEELEKIPNKSIEKKEFISYIYDLKWDYRKANQNREKTCLENKITCDKKNKIKIYWKVLDENDKPVFGAKVVLLNNPKNFTISNSKWEYKIEMEYYPFSHLRFKSSKRGYSDWYKTISFNNSNGSWERRDKLNFNLTKAHYSEEIVKSEASNLKKIRDRDYFVFETSQSKYLVPTDWLYYADWKKWEWDNLNVYMYEFKKSDKIDDLTNSDTFSPVFWYVWNLMKTFWMPYIQFFDNDTRKELFVYKSDPMILQNNIYHMQELYDNYDGIYEALTKDDMEFLVEYSKKQWWYPIDFDFLTQNNFLRWPAWWALDRNKWVWEAIPAKVLTVDGLIETRFYSINDL